MQWIHWKVVIKKQRVINEKNVSILLAGILLIICLPNFAISNNDIVENTALKNQQIQGELDCIDGGKITNDLDDREQCVYDLFDLKPDIKKVLPSLLRHMRNDSDEKVKIIIAKLIVELSHDKEVVAALRNAANNPLSDAQKIKLATIPFYYKSTIQGVALMSLAEEHDAESIPLMVEWLKKYSADAIGFSNNISVDENFNNKCIDSIVKMLSENVFNNYQKMTIISILITTFKQDPQKYTEDIKDIVLDKDEDTRNLCLQTLLTLKYPNLHIKYEDFFNELKPSLEKIRNDSNNELIESLLDIKH